MDGDFPDIPCFGESWKVGELWERPALLRVCGEFLIK